MNRVPSLCNYKCLKARVQYLGTFTARINNSIFTNKEILGPGSPKLVSNPGNFQFGRKYTEVFCTVTK